MKSKLCEMFNIKYPIIQGGIQWLATPEFASAVSNAGGLGTLNSSLYQTKDELKASIRKTRELTPNAFCVNISMLPIQVAGEHTWDFIEACCEEKVDVVELAGRDPKEFVPELKKAGVKVIHKSTAVRFAKKAEAAGVDAVSIVGFECGGFPGNDDVSTMVLIPSVVDAVNVPVIAGGGICDSRSYLAARCLGAEGVVIGTRFVATEECPVHYNFKKLFIDADERSTTMVQRTIRNPYRTFKNSAMLNLLEMEKGTPSMDEIISVTSGAKQKECYDRGDTENGAIPCGQVVGRLKKILTVKEVIDEIVTGSEEILKKLSL